MTLELPRSRVILLSVVAEQSAQRLASPGALKDGLFNISAQLKRMVDVHDQTTSKVHS